MRADRVIEVVAALVVAPTGRTLMVRKRGTDVFMNPGGKPEPGEDHTTALVREIEEETGLRVRAASLLPLGTFEAAAANEPDHRLVAHCFGLRVDSEAHAIAAEIVESRWIRPGIDVDRPLAPLAVEHLMALVGTF